jgi:hypothetical protein
VADYVTELYYSGAWQDISADVQDKQVVTIARGRRDWASDADPAVMKLRINNGASNVMPGQFGRYSPRNPMSDLYGLIGRNTPIRRRLVDRAGRLALPGVPDLLTAYAVAADHAALDIVSDIEFRFTLHPDTWRPANLVGIARRYLITDDDRSWAIGLTSEGAIRFFWSPDGTLAARLNVDSDPVPADTGALAFRIRLDVNTGAGWRVDFDTAPDVDGPWPGTALGTVTGSPATLVAPGAAPLELGRIIDPVVGGITSVPFSGTISRFQMRSGIGGTVVADGDFTDLEPETTAFTDAPGRSWTIEGAASVADPSIRFCGECSVWPPRWDLSAAEQWVPIEAAGVTRRLGKGKAALSSSLFRDFSTRANVAAYWPMEEASGAEQFASGLAGDRTVLRPSDTAQVKPAASDAFVASAPLPTVAAATISGPFPTYPAPNIDQRLVFLCQIPAAGIATDRHVARITTSGTAARWDIVYAAGGGARFRCYDQDFVLIFDHGPIAAGLNGTLVMFSLLLEQRGANVDFQLATWTVGSTIATVLDTGSVAGTYGRFTGVTLGTTVGMDNSTFGHVALLNGDVHNIWDVIGHSLQGWSGETASDRVIRLCEDNGLPVPRIIGGGHGSTAMGPQAVDTLMDLLREIPTADLGILTDRRDALGLTWRTRASLYNQTPRLVLDYASGLISDPFGPVDDDQQTRNQITLTRERGSAVTVRADTGPLSVADPPNGVGVYDYSETVSLATDEQLSDQAGWRLHLGTVDEARFPDLTLDLLNERVALLRSEILALEEGDLVRITNPPAHIATGHLDLIIDASTETKSGSVWKVNFTCSPGSPWTVGVWAGDTETPAPDAAQRYDTAGTIRASGTIAALATSITFQTQTGPLWTTNPADFPFDVMCGGERMRVTAIAAESPVGSRNQVFTVVRAINGVRKSHPTGTAVALYRPARYAL